MASTTRMSGEDRRSQLLSVARDLFVRDGYGATTADVAEGAGVSQALIVKHFGTKDELFRAAVADPLLELFEETLLAERQYALTDELGTPEEHIARLVDFGTRWGELVREHRPVLLSLLRASVEFPDVVARLFGLWRDLADDMADVFRRFAASDLYVDYDPRLATYAGLGALTIGPLLADDTEEFARSYIDMIMFGVLSDEGRRSLEDLDA